jgi:hypothetical protein
MKDKEKDLKKLIKREKTFSTLAKAEGKGAASREKSEKKSGMPESSADSASEKKIDNVFAKVREKIWKRADEKLKRIRKNESK